MKYNALVLAAGAGRRMGADRNKLLLSLSGIPVIIHTLRVFEQDPQCLRIVLVIHPSEKQDILNLLRQYRITKVDELAEGGRERQDSVYNGLQALSQDREHIVLIHDGARPFISRLQLTRAAEAADRSGAALLAVPVKDTIKQVCRGTVTKTLDRASLWAAQTPQAFRLPIILEAHRLAKAQQLSVTDDASLAEQLGYEVEVVEGSYRNIKLTTPEDLIIAEKFLQEEEKKGCE